MSTGELERKDSMFLTFYELGKDNRMHKASRKIFPTSDGDNRRFILPKTGRILTVKNAKTGKILEQFEWNGLDIRAQKMKPKKVPDRTPPDSSILAPGSYS